MNQKELQLLDAVKRNAINVFYLGGKFIAFSYLPKSFENPEILNNLPLHKRVQLNFESREATDALILAKGRLLDKDPRSASFTNIHNNKSIRRSEEFSAKLQDFRDSYDWLKKIRDKSIAHNDLEFYLSQYLRNSEILQNVNSRNEKYLEPLEGLMLDIALSNTLNDFLPKSYYLRLAGMRVVEGLYKQIVSDELSEEHFIELT